MIDVNKARNNYQKLPTLKQKCDSSVKAVPPKSFQVSVPAAAIVGAVSSTSGAVSRSAVAAGAEQAAHEKQIALSSKHLKESLQGTQSSGGAHSSSTLNAVRAANQQFFLTPEYKDQNFLKAECKLAHAQVAVDPQTQTTLHPHQLQHSFHLSHQKQLQHLKQKNKRAHAAIDAENDAAALLRGEDNRNNNACNNANHNSYNNNRSGGGGKIYPLLQPRAAKEAASAGGGTVQSRVVASIASKAEAAATTLNGLRREVGGSSHFGAVSAGGSAVRKNPLDFNSSKILSAGQNNSGYVTPTTINFNPPLTAASVPKLGGRLVKPLVHRTIPSTTVAATNALTSAGKVLDSMIVSSSHRSNNNNSDNNINIHSNDSLNNICTLNHAVNSSLANNSTQLQQAQQRSGNLKGDMQHNYYNGSLDHDDIKYIDCDEPPAPVLERNQVPYGLRYSQQILGNVSGTNAPGKTRVRPKSTIMMSTSNNLVFEKVNNYKYANGIHGGPPTAENSCHVVGNARHGDQGGVEQGRGDQGRTPATNIDSSSIKASIEKFNSYSEQKRIPLSTVTFRSNGGSGSTSNLQHHRHSSDFDNCNLRLPHSTGGGSLTRSPYRTSATSAPSQQGKFIVSMHPSAAIGINARSDAGSASNTTSSLPTKGSTGNRVHEPMPLICAVTRSSAAQLFSKDAVEKGGSAPSPQLDAGTAASSTNALPSAIPVLKLTANKLPQDAAANHNLSGVGGNNKKQLTLGGLCNTEDSVRSVASRSVLPPPSLTSTSSWDRDTTTRAPLITTSTHNASTSEVGSSSSSSSKAASEKIEGLCGLRNIGNTCFMNSVIQCLSHTNELTKFLRNHYGVRASASKDQQILYEFAKLIREMWTSNVHSVTPMELKRAFSTKHRMYSDYNQQDAQEFLRFFLDSLHSALNTGVKGELLKIDDNLTDNKKAEQTWDWYTRHENSLIRDLFVGQLKSTLKCTTCGNTSVTFDPFWDLSVPLPSSSRCKLDSCLDLFIREEILDGDEMPTCSKCKTRRKCTKSFTIQRFPKYLVIHLKRFSETRWSKLSNIVEFPTGERELNMGPYGSNPNLNIYYSLYAISNHMGSTAGGHYVALCKHPVSKKWHEFNDNIVSDSLSEHHLVSSSAYILFYERA